MSLAKQSSLIGHFTPQTVWDSGEALIFVKGKGCFVYDSEGGRYIDGVSGLFCSQLGHGRDDIAQAAARQMGTLGFMPNWSSATDIAIETTKLVVDRLPNQLNAVFFVNSGSEANEAAMKFAIQLHRCRGQTERRKFISRKHSYHGTTLGALSLTALPAFRAGYGDLLLKDVINIPNTSIDRTGSKSQLPSIQETLKIVEREGPETIAAIFAEPVQNGGGALVPDPTYWPQLRKLCDEYGILLVADEVITGFGRLGRWFGSEVVGANPDILTFAKGATSGYFPAGGMAVRKDYLDEICDVQGMYQHGATWGAHPVSMAVIKANILAMENEAVLENVRTLQVRWFKLLQELSQHHHVIEDVRGTGFMNAIELTRDRSSGKKLTDEEIQWLVSDRLPRAFRTCGTLFKADNRGGAMIILCPPLIASSEILDLQLNHLDEVLTMISKDLVA